MGRPRELTEEERAELIAKGYKPVEVWVPDWDSPEVQKRIKRECEAINESDRRSGELEYADQLVADLWDDLPG
jgi:antidote-toxin recognition MazE-like antitoxin